MAVMQIYPFNNSVETGLRALCILKENFPVSYDLGMLVLFDYLCVHSGDFDTAMESLHPPTPQRSGEIFVRRALIEQGLNLFISKGLIEARYLNTGLEYIASEYAAPFLDNFGANYVRQLIIRAEWLRTFVARNSKTDLQALVKNKAQNYLFETTR